MTDLREFMRRVPQCVTVVTTFDGSKPHGMTVSSFTSVSLEPQLVLIVLEKTTQTCRNVLETKRFCVNLLSEKQAAVSDLFAYAPHDDRFEKVKYRLEDGFYPVIDGAVATLFCEVHNHVEAATHNIILGLVKDIKIFSDQQPLVYFQRQYYRPAKIME
ncbi:MAG: flavin reductase family protein [Candidatus Caldarchaeum sp.]|nr:flavin reductase family protein [Candidatus Caldarchaeum sp.]MCS7133679.1 flavin reductase family protein [Candidatus Caldarchaeum sp.]MCX8201575.1 flavin reductase family protein [Candidatus Caldarchaeum sp.]MDW8062891.1 flavin reductase family protein [Candidatus Caldarchaeum sp.]MDW8435025.1 flavin reductase family protein [Candidatus Caldarchaeum sp.]